MQIPLVMTILGKDQLGVVDLVAQTLSEHGANWLESRMSHLGGQFAGILRVTVDSGRSNQLIEALKRLEPRLIVVVHPDEEQQPEPAEVTYADLEVIGVDRPGIVHQISHALAKHGVNVEELQSECSSAAMSGEMLFRAIARLHIPKACDVEQLEMDLGRIAEDLLIEVSLEELPLDEEPEPLQGGKMS